MRQEKHSVLKDGKWSVVALKLPDEVKNGHYEIGYAWIQSCPAGSIAESEADFELQSIIILNMNSSRLLKAKDILMEEINQKIKADGCKNFSRITMYDMWDEKGIRVILPPKDIVCSECGQVIDPDSIGVFKHHG